MAEVAVLSSLACGPRPCNALTVGGFCAFPKAEHSRRAESRAAGSTGAARACANLFFFQNWDISGVIYNIACFFLKKLGS